jgi:hypothetical protein
MRVNEHTRRESVVLVYTTGVEEFCPPCGRKPKGTGRGE